MRLHDEIIGEVLVCFDGRVLEVFGQGLVAPSRFHIGMLIVAVEEPDRKGRHQIDFAPVRAGRNGIRLLLNERDRQTIEPLIAELRQALPAATWRP